MAEPLKNRFDERIPRTIGEQISAVWPDFDTEAFLALANDGFEELELMDRGTHFAHALRRHLPEDYRGAIDILLASLGDRPTKSDGDGGMASFLYLPHVALVAEYGIDDFDVSMKALYELTKRFTGEFSIRPFIERYEPESLELLRRWAADPDPHVRRLVSEGTRPRLPWAGRLRRFQQDPAPVLDLLELLKDDPDPMVRRSVANNLNDIGKDHPDLLIETATCWLTDAGGQRRDLIRHALRSLVRSGDRRALALLGYETAASVIVENVLLAPASVARGGSVAIRFDVRNGHEHAQSVLVDVRIHYVKSNGSASPKGFRLKDAELAPGEAVTCRKVLKLADLTTRRHYPGIHRVEAVVNGQATPIGAFELLDETSG